MRTDRIREIERKSKRKTAKVFQALGLTTRGTKYVKPRLSQEERKARALKRYHARARYNFSLGLNSRGKQRAYMIVLGAAEASILEAEINNLIAEISRVYESLPERAKVNSIKLAHALSTLRRQIALVEKEEAPS